MWELARNMTNVQFKLYAAVEDVSNKWNGNREYGYEYYSNLAISTKPFRYSKAGGDRHVVVTPITDEDEISQDELWQLWSANKGVRYGVDNAHNEHNTLVIPEFWEAPEPVTIEL